MARRSTPRKGPSQPPDYRTYSAEVTGSRRNLPHHRSSRRGFFCHCMAYPAQASLVYITSWELSRGISLFFIKSFSYFCEFCLPRSARQRELFRFDAPGSRARTAAYFLCEQKVGKKSLEPTVQDSLDGEAHSRLSPIRGCLQTLGDNLPDWVPLNRRLSF